MAESTRGKPSAARGPDELSVEELEEVSGGEATNVICPTTNEKSCNTDCKPATAPTVS
ncbi:MAG TPA: hypothetical protein VGR37_10745 [Longimicrobiaceae bacterium]|nr:hypothetical protein [Longimicrobiaceae bacterium]